MKTYPTNKQEFWQILDSNWNDIYNIILQFTPDHAKDADNLRLFQNPKISSVLNDAWWAAPDHPSIHNIPGWDVLCNLCSESFLLEENEEVND